MASRTKAASAVDQQLEKYRSMRDFKVTAEPSGGHDRAEADGGLPFVIQKHAATRLHYDFRLGWRGVLKSWAVAKGPSYVPGDKRLAVQVEDHPIEYGGFEGTIPKGQYGGGTVMVWDEGTWEPQPGHDVDTMLQKGSLKFILHGRKLQGKWALVRMGGRAANEAKPNWLLIKEHDEYERSAEYPPITEEMPDSVVTGRNLDQIAKAEDHVWQSKGAAEKERSPSRDNRLRARLASKKGTARRNGSVESTPSEIAAKTSEERLPGFLSPQLATEAERPPEGPEWIHELKLDGYRIQARIDHGGRPGVTLFTRRGLDWTARMKPVASELERLPVKSAVVDGEVAVLDERGLSSFAELQAAFQEHLRKHMTYFAFDLLHLDGHNLRELPLSERKALLKHIVESLGEQETIRFSDHIEGKGDEIFREACKARAEGIVSKLAASPYFSGRNKNWLKVKCQLQQEFVVGGFTLPGNQGDGIGALLLGYYEDGKLIYAGRTGTGFTQKTQRLLRKRLEGLKASKMAYEDVPREARADAIWVKPELVAEVAFSNWTTDKLVRQAAFKGLREDKPAREVIRETAPEARGKHPAKSAHTQSSSHGATTKSPKTNSQAPALPVKLSHPEKVLDLRSGLMKKALAEYYLAIAPYMLPHIADRPVSIIRCPDGVGGQCFFQRHLKEGLPKHVQGIDIADKKGQNETYITFSSVEALVGLAQMNVLELHPWGCRNEDIEHPDRLIFDLDPDEELSWRVLADSALEVRKRLQRIGLKSWVKTTGGKGIHVVAPIEPKYDWPTVKEAAHTFVLQMEAENRKLFLTKMTKSARKGKIYLDYLRNERGATAVAAYSPRARPGMNVSMPLKWSELNENECPHFPVVDFENWEHRLRADPWKDMLRVSQSFDLDRLGAPPKP